MENIPDNPPPASCQSGSLSLGNGSAPVDKYPHTRAIKFILAEHPDHLGYAYAEAEDADDWNGPHKTREDAIAEMRDHGWNDGWVSAVRAISETDEDVDEEWAFVCYGPREQIPQNEKCEPRR